jgi:hypothetical protein
MSDKKHSVNKICRRSLEMSCSRPLEMSGSKLGRIPSGLVNRLGNSAMKSSWPTCASCGQSRTAIVRATRWMPRRWLAMPGLDPEILRPIAHRTVAQQETLTLIRARDVLVRLRTGAVNSVRGLAKPCGYRACRPHPHSASQNVVLLHSHQVCHRHSVLCSSRSRT